MKQVAGETGLPVTSIKSRRGNTLWLWEIARNLGSGKKPDWRWRADEILQAFDALPGLTWSKAADELPAPQGNERAPPRKGKIARDSLPDITATGRAAMVAFVEQLKGRAAKPRKKRRTKTRKPLRCAAVHAGNQSGD